MPTSGNADQPIVLLTGGSGYVGGRLIPLLERQGVNLRCLARNPDKLLSHVQAATEVVPGTFLIRLRWTGRCRAFTPPTNLST